MTGLSESCTKEKVSQQFGVHIYFTDSYASWQKGNIENADKLIRQYIPKETDIGKITDKRIKAIQAKINEKPREKLKFNTPNEVFSKYYR